MTYDEHLDWCKKRALEYLNRGDIQNAIASMLSDLSKHEETRKVGEALGGMGMTYVINRDLWGARNFIGGFR